MPAVLEGTADLEDVLMVEDAKKRRLTRRKSVGGGRGSAGRIDVDRIVIT